MSIAFESTKTANVISLMDGHRKVGEVFRHIEDGPFSELFAIMDEDENEVSFSLDDLNSLIEALQALKKLL